MDSFFYVGFILDLFFALYILFFSRFCLNSERVQKAFYLFFLVGISFVVSASFYLGWIFDVFAYEGSDLLLILSILILFRVVLLISVFSLIFNNNHIYSLLFFYSFVLFSYFFDVVFSWLLLTGSFLVIFMLSLILYSRKIFRRVGLIGVFCSFSCLLLVALLYFGLIKPIFVALFFSIFLFFFILSVVGVIRRKSDVILKKSSFKRRESLLLDFLKYFVFVLVLSNFVFIGTVSVHELGHFASSKYLGCGSTRIVYEEDLPHTEALCGDESSMRHIFSVLGGVLLPLVVSLFFVFSGGQFIREIGVLITGYNFLISYKDFVALGFSDTFSVFVVVIGLIVVLFSVGLLISSRADENRFILFTEGHKVFYKDKHHK